MAEPRGHPQRPAKRTRTFEQVGYVRERRDRGNWSRGATTSNLDGQLASRQHFDFTFLGAFARLSVPPLRLRRT